MKAFRDDCILIENNLALWVGGDLDAEARDRVDQHLAVCEHCAGTARALEESRRTLIGRLRSEETPAPDLWPGIAEALRREGRLTPRPQEDAAAVTVRRPAAIVEPRAIPEAVPGAITGAIPGAIPGSSTGAITELRPRKASAWARFGLAAAAAVMAGFMLGRLASDAPPRGDSPPGISIVRPPSVARPSSPSTGVVPVSDGVSLHRLAPGEPRLSDGALNLPEEEDLLVRRPFFNPNDGSPASLQSVTRR
jgi:anti-sigma factor RsiW